MPPNIDQLLKQAPVVTILRGIAPDEIVDAANTLVTNDMRIIEVPMNSPQPYESIRILSHHFSDQCICGAGTVVNEQQVELVHQAGGTLIVAPNTNTAVIKKSIALGMTPVPGFATASEAFEAIAAGARYLKLFPASSLGTDFLRALLTVLPTDIKIIATGGIGTNNMQEWLKAGVSGFGIGSELYSVGISKDEFAKRATAIAGKLPK